jgi:3-phosphoshikimate 1-carboxyvinyltransferase
MRIRPAQKIKGVVRLPGDKSISHRAAMIAALATGSSSISNFATSRDCASTLSCLEQLGILIEHEGTEVRIEGAGGHLSLPVESLDCGNSGTTMRMLSGILAAQGFPATLTGDESLRSRPMARIIEPLERMGARVVSEASRPPLHIEGRRPLKAIRYELPVPSAQVKSCVLLAGLGAEGRTEVVERTPTRDHTERMLRWFAAPIETRHEGEARVHAVTGPAAFSGGQVNVPGDFSSAAFLIAAAVLLPDSDLLIENVGLNPTRTRFLDFARSFGVEITIDERTDSNEPVGDLRIRQSETVVPDSGSMRVDKSMVVDLIDELPLLGVIGSQSPGGLVIQDATELRAKESDRIAATVTNLRAMGAQVEEVSDGFSVDGPVQLRGARLESFGDHRIAMAFSVAALVADGESEINGSECVEISFPGFFDCLESVIER